MLIFPGAFMRSTRGLHALEMYSNPETCAMLTLPDAGSRGGASQGGASNRLARDGQKTGIVFPMRGICRICRSPHDAKVGKLGAGLLAARPL
ncbi:hypothetical protein PH5382_02511 [Phaeobacter sp. CECT 5382]|nr:hypothetical protein PH5382_02511 [Phaeobacter sp. CECT 5382]